MLNIFYEDLPTFLNINGKEFLIDTDFRTWIALNEALQDISLSDEEKGSLLISLLFIEEVPDDFDAVITAVLSFLQGNAEDRRHTSSVKKSSRYVFSFTYDQDYIVGGFLEYYGIDLLQIEYMHWWYFNALLNALNSECELKKRIGIRSMKLSDISDKKERNRICKIQREIAIPAAELCDEDIAAVF